MVEIAGFFGEERRVQVDWIFVPTVKEHWQVKRYAVKSNVPAFDSQVRLPVVRSEFFVIPVKHTVKEWSRLEGDER